MVRHTIQAQLGTNSDGSTNVDLKLEVFPNNRLLCLQHVGVVNRDNASDKVDVGLIIGGSIMWITTITMTNANDIYSWSGELFFKSCKTIILRFRGTTDGDDLEGYVYGYYLE